MTKLAARLVLAFALVGLGASVAAAYVHYQLLSDPLYTSFCDVSATMSCTQVYQSRFSTVGGIPVAIFGGDLVRVRGAAGDRRHGRAAAGPREHPRLPVRALDARARGGPVPALRVGRDSESVLPDVPADGCGGHRDLHHFRRVRVGPDDDLAPPDHARTCACSPAIRWPLPWPCCLWRAPPRRWRSFRAKRQPNPARRRRRRPRNSAASSSSSWRRPRGFRSSSRAMAPRCSSSSSTTFSVRPARNSHMAYKPILAKYEAQAPGAVKVVLMDYPLNSTCNPNSSMLHAAACDAAVAVRLARRARPRRGDGRVALHAPGRNDAGHGPSGGARGGTGHRLRREICRDARARQGRRRARHAARISTRRRLFSSTG